MSFYRFHKTWNNFLFEARIDKIIAKFPEHEEAIRQLSASDPSGNDAYLTWMIKQVAQKSYSVQSVVELVQAFHTNRQRLDNKDINQWEFHKLEDKLKELGQSKTSQKKEIKEEGVIKIHEDEHGILLAPLSMEASCKYGAGTKWCISAKQHNQFGHYVHDSSSIFIFYISKSPTINPKLKKIAFRYVFSIKTLPDASNPTGIFNANNERLKNNPIGPKRWQEYASKISAYLPEIRHAFVGELPPRNKILIFDNFWGNKHLIMGRGKAMTPDGVRITELRGPHRVKEIGPHEYLQPKPLEELNIVDFAAAGTSALEYPFSLEESVSFPNFDFQYITDGQTHKWYYKNELHRIKGPAHIEDGDAFWYKDGKLHNTDGPAVRYKDGKEKWFINGVEIKSTELDDAVSKLWKLKEQLSKNLAGVLNVIQ